MPKLYPNPKCRDCKGTGRIKKGFYKGSCRCNSVEGPKGQGIKVDLPALWGNIANQKLKVIK